MVGVSTLAAAGVVLVSGTPASAEVVNPPVGKVFGDTNQALPGSYIVQLKGTAYSGLSTAQAKTNVSSSAKALTARHGGKVTSEYSVTLKGFAVSGLSEAQAARLAADPSVASVSRDMLVRESDTQYNPGWNLDRIDSRTKTPNYQYTYPNTASSVTAYVIDTGLYKEHSEFGGRASWGRNFVDRAVRKTPDPYGRNTPEHNLPENVSDCRGHGTHVAGTLGGTTYGVAKQVKIVGVRVLDCNGEGYTSEVVAGVEWVTANAAKPAVVNMSLGSTEIEPLQDEAVRKSIASGLTYTLSAGNGDGNPTNPMPLNACDHSPGRVTDALTVGASFIWEGDGVEYPAVWSNYGPCVDIFAPGVDVKSAWIPDPTDPEVPPGPNPAIMANGTSMASPHVAGAAALILQAHPTYSPSQVRQAIIQSATNGVLDMVNNYPPYARNTANRLLYIRQNDPPRIASKPVGINNQRFGTTEVYGRTTDNKIVYAYRAGSEWSDWSDLGGDTQGDPAVLYNPTYGTTEVYARLANNHLAYRYYSNGWSGWNDLGGELAGNPSILYNPKYGTTEIYARFADGTLKYKYYANGWSGWSDLGGSVASDPALLYNPKYGTTEVYVRTTDNKVKYKYYNNGWSGWVSLEGNVSGNPGVIYNPTYGTTEVYTRTSTNTLAYRYYYNGWADWIDLKGSLASDPGVIYNPRYGTTEAYAATAGGQTQYVYYYKGWSGWNNIGGAAVSAPSVLFNVSNRSTQVYTRSADNHANFAEYNNSWASFIDISA
ncbi:S8 family serine peptidase [Dactylosporangium sp. CA-152071]|uniref:S8 family serine peptidase n=1 Tax=Dactylosporangium sp. CA-152071 TaxID=3239933 RepID=UPI003D89FAA8